MSLAALSSKVIYSGDGSTTAFTYSFPIQSTDGSDLIIFVVDDAGVVTQLTGNYTVNVGTSTVNYPTVGGVSPLASGINALPNGWQIVIMRVEALTQALALTNQGVFDADSINDELDKLTMITQQLQEQIDRCVKYPVNTTPSTADVASFLAAVDAVMPPFSADTYANLKILSAANPTTRRWGYALDQGTGQLYFYTANLSSGDQGWILVGG
jgi:hypothetical protein